MWHGKKVIFDKEGFASMFLFEKRFDCRYGADTHVNAKQKYKDERNVSYL